MRLALLLVCVTASAAGAEPVAATPKAPEAPALEVIDRGIAVEIIARNVKATRTAIIPVRSRLEIEIDGPRKTPRLAPKDDTIHSVEFSGRSNPVLSVKLDFSRSTVQSLARFSQAIQVGDDLHVLVPRALPVEGAGVVLPEPTLPPALLAKLALPPIPPVAAAATTQPPPATPSITGATVPTSSTPPPATGAGALAPVEAAPGPRADAPKPAVLAKAPDSLWRRITMYGAIGFAAIGCGVWLLRKRKAAQQPGSCIEVIAQRSLGAKAKIVWLNAGGREMIVSVTAQQVRMLGQWRKTDDRSARPMQAMQAMQAPHALPEAMALPGPADRAVDRAADRSSSPTVAGILRLRARTNSPMVSEEVATGDLDADALWAKEILAATGARR